MKKLDRLLLALAVVIVDALVFVVPVTGLATAYVLLARPPFFRAWVERLYAQDA